MTVKNKVSILGCGWLGLPLAQRMVSEGYQVKGSTTTENKIESLKNDGIEPYHIRFDPELDGVVGDFFDTDILILNVPPRTRSKEASYHINQIERIIELLTEQVKTLIYVSSTSIYPRENGDYDEETLLSSEITGNKTILHAEKLVQDFQGIDHKYILRSAGQMGKERIPGKYFAGKRIKGATDLINYIHLDDLIGIIYNVVDKLPASGIYNMVAPVHPIKKDVVNKSISEMGFEKALQDGTEEVGKRRLIIGDKIIDALDYQFKYPDPLRFRY